MLCALTIYSFFMGQIAALCLQSEAEEGPSMQDVVEMLQGTQDLDKSHHGKDGLHLEDACHF